MDIEDFEHQAKSTSDIDADLNSVDLDIETGATGMPDPTEQLEDPSQVKQYKTQYETVMKHLSVYKYESLKSVIREYVSNMNSACRDAEDEIDDDTYQPIIHIAYYPATDVIVIEDNGIGFSSERLDGAGIHLGKGTNRFDPEQPGLFGVGMMSALDAVGFDGAFPMYSKSRRTDELTKGLWTAYGFIDDDDLTDTSLPEPMGESQYGTRFELPLKDNVDIDIHSAVEDVCEYSRVPVLYTERSPSGDERFSDEYGGRSETPFLDKYEFPEQSLVIDTDAYRAVFSPESSGRTVLLDVPIKRNGIRSKDVMEDLTLKSVQTETSAAPFNGRPDVLIKSELQTIVAGPHEGTYRIGDRDYKSDVNEEDKDKFTPKSACSENDIWIPAPAGDRDRLEENIRFWSYLRFLGADRMRQEFQKLERVIENGEGLRSLEKSTLSTLGKKIEQKVRWAMDDDDTTVREKIKHTFSVEDPSRGVVEAAKFLSQRVSYCLERPTVSSNGPIRRGAREKTSLRRIIDKEEESDGNIYIANTPTYKKARVLWEDDRQHHVVQASSELVEEATDRFGWKKLHETVTRKTIDQFNISKETREDFETKSHSSNPNAGKEAPDREVTVHRMRCERKGRGLRSSRKWKRGTESFTAENIRKHFTEEDELSTFGDFTRLVLFPSNTDENLTDYRKRLATGGVRVANCAVKTWEYLRDAPHVYHIENLIEEARSTEFESTHGTKTLPELANETGEVFIHYTPPEIRSTLLKSPELDRAGEWVRSKASVDTDAAYVPVSDGSLHLCKLLLDDDRIGLFSLSQGLYVPNQYKRTQNTTFNRMGSLWKMYIAVRLKEWEGTPIYKALRESQKSVTTTENRQMIDELAADCQSGIPPLSERGDAL